MKKFLAFLIAAGLFASLMAADAPRGWQTNMNDAVKLAEKEKKPLVILITGPKWNPACQKLNRKVIDDNRFNKAIQKYAVCLYLNQPKEMDSSSQIARDIQQCTKIFGKKIALPHYMILDLQQKVLAANPPKTAEGYVAAVAAAAEKMGHKIQDPKLQKYVRDAAKEQKKQLKKQKTKDKDKDKDKKKDKDKDKDKDKKKDKDKDKKKDKDKDKKKDKNKK